MKNIITIISLLLISAVCFSQTNEISLIGKWQLIEKHESDGAKKYTVKVKDGEIFIFEKGNSVKDGLGNKGKYILQDDHLHISLLENEQFYRVLYDKNMPEKLFLVPVNSEYFPICDEGCTEVYKRILQK